jgi:hypothetical protein
MGGITTDKSWRYNLPRAEGESKLIAPGTPLAILGLFILALRYRFGPLGMGEPFIGGGSIGGMEETAEQDNLEPLPWIWDADLQPENECAPPPDVDRTKILIESGNNVKKSVRNYRPAIYVERNGPIVPQKVVIDNRAGSHIPSGSESYFALAPIPLIFHCYADTDGESSLLADTVWFYLLATKNIFRESFGIYDIDMAVLGMTNLDESADKECWLTSVTLQITVELRWGVRPISPLLREIALRVENVGDPNLFYHQIALRETDG